MAMRWLTTIKLEDVCKRSRDNRASIFQASKVGCYFCLRTFPADEVVEWADGGETALCPYCRIDAVLPDISEGAFLSAAHERWFT